jgi:hypothetical protein
VAGLKEPQGEVPQVTVQVTPAFLLSLATVAIRGVGALVTSVAGGEFRATEIAGGVGGVGDEPDPPHEVRQRVKAARAKREIVWRNFI